MARWLAGLGLCYGLAVGGTGSYLLSQDSPAQTGAVTKIDHADKKTARGGEQNRDNRQRNGHTHPDQTTKKERPGADRPSDDHREGRRAGPPRDQARTWWPTYGWRRVADSLRKDGGPLELMPLLHVREVRQELGLENDVFKPKLAAYMVEMETRMVAVRNQIEPNSDTDWYKLFEEPMAKENEHFQRFIDGELSQAQLGRLISLFVQARGYRAAGNQLVATRIGIDFKEAAKLRKDIDQIREEVMRESAPLFRRAFEKGADRDKFEELVSQSHKRMNARIEKLLTEEQREKLTQLRGKEIAGPPRWLVRGVEMPRPPAQPRDPSRAVPKSDCSDARSKCRPKGSQQVVRGPGLSARCPAI